MRDSQSREAGSSGRCRARLWVSAIVGRCAFTGALTGGPAGAGAASSSVSSVGSPIAQASASRGFRIYNLSSHPLRPISAEHAPAMGSEQPSYGFEGRPDDGAVLMPGEVPHAWEVAYSSLYVYGARVSYEIVGTGKRYTANLYVDPFENDSYCEIDSQSGKCSAGGLTLTVTDPKGTVNEVPASQAQKQAETLRQLCTKSSRSVTSRR